ncbi:MAG: terminase small subunit [Candidatus Dormibacteria bacterium]
MPGATQRPGFSMPRDGGTLALGVVRMPRTTKPLSDKEARFVGAYLVSLNASKAAIEAGYKATRNASKTAWLLLRNPRIQKAIEAAQAKVLKKHELTLDKIVGEAALIAFANIQDYMSITAEGDPYVDLSKLTREQAAALAEFTVDDYTDGRGEHARNVRKVRIKLADKLAALVALGKHLGGFRTKLDLGGQADNPINLLVRNFHSLAELDKDERAALRAMLTRRLEQPHGGVEGPGPD